MQNYSDHYEVCATVVLKDSFLDFVAQKDYGSVARVIGLDCIVTDEEKLYLRRGVGNGGRFDLFREQEIFSHRIIMPSLDPEDWSRYICKFRESITGYWSYAFWRDAAPYDHLDVFYFENEQDAVFARMLI